MNLNICSQTSNSKQAKNTKILKLIRKFSFLLFLQVTISFEGFGFQIELKYQPVLQKELLTEVIEKLDITESSNVLTR